MQTLLHQELGRDLSLFLNRNPVTRVDSQKFRPLLRQLCSLVGHFLIAVGMFPASNIRYSPLDFYKPQEWHLRKQGHCR